MGTAAIEAYGAARTEEACHLWHRERELSSALPPDDPRRATSASNVGLALLIDGRTKEASAALEEAIAGLGEGALAWIDTMEISFGARSSIFHFRMEQRHEASYATVRRASNRKLLTGSVALTKFNLALVQYHLDRDESADELLKDSIELRRSSCGPSDGLLATMLALYAARLDAIGRPEEAEENSCQARQILARPPKRALEFWNAERPSKLCDQRRLLAATYLTACVHDRDVI